jgi:hypothetical protein
VRDRGGLEAPDYFPYTHSGEPGLPRYLLTRAEGLPFRQALWSAPSYLRKWRHAKKTAPPEEVRYFDDQRQLVGQLAREPPGEGVRLAMVGDLMWLRKNWHSFLDPEVLDYLNGQDVVLGNLESPISAHFAVPALLPDYLTYNSDPGLVTSFRRSDGTSTFTALALCNNHTLDRGDQGALDTLDFVDAQGIRHAGLRRHGREPSFATWQSKGITFGFYAACWGLNDPGKLGRTALQIEVLPGIAPQVQRPVDLSGVQRALTDMTAAGVDFKIVYLHWGYEFEFYPCPDLMQVGRAIIQAGADMVMGSHPHVVQPLEVCFVNGYQARYGGRWQNLPALAEKTGCVLSDGAGVPRKGLIVYSLGNFASAMFTAHCRIGMALGLEVQRDAAGRTDWSRPEMRLVYNVPGHQRLVLLQEYLNQRASIGKRDVRLRAMADFIQTHVCGPNPYW